MTKCRMRVWQVQMKEAAEARGPGADQNKFESAPGPRASAAHPYIYLSSAPAHNGSTKDFHIF